VEAAQEISENAEEPVSERAPAAPRIEFIGHRGERLAPGDAPASLGSLVGEIPTGPWFCSGIGRAQCGAEVQHPGLCDTCSRDVALAAQAARARSWLRRSLPKDHHDVTWDRLLELKNYDGKPRVVGMSEERLARIRESFGRLTRVVLVGPAGAGKSTLAAAHLRACAEHDLERRVRFLEAGRLGEQTIRVEGLDGPAVHVSPVEWALAADVLALDDLGAELEGAQPGSGLLAQRIGPACKVIVKRFLRGRPTVITTGIGVDTKSTRELQGAIASLYGDRVARRMLEGAAVIRLGGAAKVRAA